MNKPLSAYQSVLWLLGRKEPFLIQWNIAVSNTKLTDSQVQRALALIQSQHPLLQSTITSTRPFQFKDTKKPIPLVEHNCNLDEWTKIANAALKQPLPREDDNTFLQVDWINNDQSHVFIFTIDHAFSDGRCLVELCKDFLHTLDQVLADVDPIKVTLYPERPSVEEMYPTGLPDLDTPETEIAFNDADTPIKTAAPYNYLEPYVMQLTENETSNILSFCKANHASVHGVLCAIFSNTLNQLLIKSGKSGEDSFCFTPGDTRSYLTEKVERQELGNFATPIFHPFTIGEPIDIVPTAKRITKQITQHYQSNHISKVSSFREDLESQDAESVVSMFKIRNDVTGLSNIGVIDMPEHFEHFKVNFTQFGVASPIMSGRDRVYWCVVSTMHGKMQLEFIQLDVNEAGQVESFAQEIKKQLLTISTPGKNS